MARAVSDRGKPDNFEIDEEKVVRCPLHDEPMKFEVLTNLRRCPVARCKMVAMPRREASRGQRIVGKGEPFLMRILDDQNSPHYYVCSEDNLMIDVTSSLIDVDTKPSTTSGMEHVTVTLRFVDVPKVVHG